jgi:hypothetical protein
LARGDRFDNDCIHHHSFFIESQIPGLRKRRTMMHCDPVPLLVSDLALRSLVREFSFSDAVTVRFEN